MDFKPSSSFQPEGHPKVGRISRFRGNSHPHSGRDGQKPCARQNFPASRKALVSLLVIEGRRRRQEQHWPATASHKHKSCAHAASAAACLAACCNQKYTRTDKRTTGDDKGRARTHQLTQTLAQEHTGSPLSHTLGRARRIFSLSLSRTQA